MPACAAANLLTIGDRLNDKGVEWAWFSGGWNDAVAGHPIRRSSIITSRSPTSRTTRPAPLAGAPQGRERFWPRRAGNLPAVSFVKPVGAENEHPGYADLARGEQHTAELIEA